MGTLDDDIPEPDVYNPDAVTERHDMRGPLLMRFDSVLGPDDKTPVQRPRELCLCCDRWVPFRWMWGDYRFESHGLPVDTVVGELPGEECPGTNRPIVSQIRITRPKVLFF